MVFLDTGTPSTSRDIYSEDADDRTLQSFIVLVSLVFELAGGQNDPQSLTFQKLHHFRRIHPPCQKSPYIYLTVCGNKRFLPAGLP